LQKRERKNRELENLKLKEWLKENQEMLTVAYDGHVTDPTMLLTAQDQTVIKHTALWHQTGLHS